MIKLLASAGNRIKDVVARQAWDLNPRRSSRPFLASDYWLGFADLKIVDTTSHEVLQDFIEKHDTPTVFIESNCLFSYLDTLLNVRGRFRLITSSNDDVSVPYRFVPPREEGLVGQCSQLLDENSMLVEWFTKNPSLVHRKLHPLPLGPKWQWGSTDFFGENKAEHWSLFRRYGSNPEELFADRAQKKTRLLYLNFSDTTAFAYFTEHEGIRPRVRDALIQKFHWDENEKFGAYFRNLAFYRFCVCPPGRGLDTHRLWESLMVGTIPIVLSSPLDELYRDLPVLVVHDWASIDREFLEEKYGEMHSGTYRFDICYSHYWEEKFAERGVKWRGPKR